MSTVYMEKCLFPDAIDGNGQHSGSKYVNGTGMNTAYEYKGPAVSTGNGDSILCPPDTKNGQVTIHVVSAGSCQLQYTTSPIADVVAGSAFWLNLGSAVTNTDLGVTMPSGGYTAFRIVVASGTFQLTSRIQ